MAANPVEPDLALHQSLPHLLRNLLRNPVEPDLALHQSLPEPSPEPSPKTCWTWHGSAPKPPRPSPEPSSEPCWTWPGALKPPGTFSGTFFGPLLNLTWLCTNGTFSGTFCGNLLNRNLLRNPVEPDLALRQSLPDLHRSLLRNPVEFDLALRNLLQNLLRNLLRNVALGYMAQTQHGFTKSVLEPSVLFPSFIYWPLLEYKDPQHLCLIQSVYFKRTLWPHPIM